MTEKQRNYILYLDNKCMEQGLTIRASDDDLLGKGWFEEYRSFTPPYTNEVIEKLKMALNMPIEKFEPRKSRKRR